MVGLRVFFRRHSFRETLRLLAMTSTRLFETYEREYLKLTGSAAKDIERVDQLLPSVERDAAVKDANKALESADEIVQSMELEARSLSGSAKQELVAQARDYKSNNAALRAKLRAVQTSSRAQAAARDELLQGSDPTLRMEADNQRTRLMANTERMQRGTDKLRAAAQTALETEVIGQSIMGDLESQRQTIQHARSTLAGASVGLDRSKRILQGMGRRAMQNKILMYVIIAVISCMILFIVWFKWFYHPAPPLPPCYELHPPPPPPVRHSKEAKPPVEPYLGPRACPPPPGAPPFPPPLPPLWPPSLPSMNATNATHLS